jgi:alcohol dehydrogenase class IV
MESAQPPFAGTYEPQGLKKLLYGSGVVKEQLVSCLPGPSSKAFIVTGNSLSTKTPLVRELQEVLTPERHAGTFAGIQQHNPEGPLQQALAQVKGDTNIDTIISVGGGSPIDAAKSIIYNIGTAEAGRWLTHIAIPTTLGAAECTFFGGTTMADGMKKGIRHPDVIPHYILYDSHFGLYTPPHLFMSTGIRALDHAVELQYHPSATWLCRVMCLRAISTLFDLLPKYKANPKDEDTIVRLFLAAYASLGLVGQNIKGSLGLSHTVGYSLGSPYGIPHGVTSCLTLGPIVKLKARFEKDDAKQIAAILPAIGGIESNDLIHDCELVGDKIIRLVSDLGLSTTLTQWKVDRDQVAVICARATGVWMPGESKQEKEPGYDAAVRAVIESLY